MSLILPQRGRLASVSAAAGISAVSFVTSHDFPEQSNVTTWSQTLSIGAADTNRVVLVASPYQNVGSSTDRAISSCSIGGVTATVLRNHRASTGAGDFIATGWFWALVPTGTTANISVTFSGVIDRLCFGVYRVITSNQNLTVQDFVDAPRDGDSSGVYTYNLDTPDNGILLGQTSTINAGTVTWSRGSADFSIDMSGNDYGSGMHDYPTTSATGASFTSTDSSTNPGRWIGAALSVY